MVHRSLPLAALTAVALLCGAPPSLAAGKDDAAAIRACAAKYADNIDQAEQRCIFAIVADPCTMTPVTQTGAAAAECYDRERKIWDALLNENFHTLRDDLDDGQKAKLRNMQRAWVASREATCGFYYEKIRGSMATSMTAACLARETARRALLLKLFQGL